MEQVMSPQSPKTVYSIAIELGAAKSGSIPPTLSRAIHACVMEWFNLGSAEIANKIHNSQQSPITLSGLIGNRRPRGTQSGDRFTIRIGLLDGSLVQALLQGIEQWGTRSLELAGFPFAIRNVYALPGSHRLARSADYQLLADLPAMGEELVLHFLSPTSFKQQQDIQPFPLPELVFGNLQRRWNHFAPEELKFPPLAWQASIAAFDLKTHALKMKSGAEIGAQGWVKYKFRDRQQAKIATVLSHFAFFAGVGRKTSMGMGQTMLKE
jgi:CRISPR-associated endoribonuclease Cas6